MGCSTSFVAERVFYCELLSDWKRKSLILLWRREWDSVSRSTFIICNLLIPHCQGYRKCHLCRGALPGIARQPIGVEHTIERRPDRYVMVPPGSGRSAVSAAGGDFSLPRLAYGPGEYNRHPQSCAARSYGQTVCPRA